jgi:3-hydroxybutyryl-CoA dehydrogenase
MGEILKLEDIKRVAVLGAGQMGAGIAQVCAMAGYEVVMRDIEDRFIQKGLSGIKGSLDKMVAKGKMAQADADAVMKRIKTTLKVDECKDVQLVIEAVIEDLNLKKQVFGELDKLCAPTTIFASNTSSISITKIGASVKRSDRFIGMHFMNPVPVMKLVEVINGHMTDPKVTELVMKMSEKLGKTPVEVNDSPGFVSNRVLLPMLNEAIYCLYEGVGTKESIDSVMKLGMNHPMGPLELADLIGLDTCLHIMEVLYDGFDDSKYRPCPLLKKMVDANLLGRKTGRGFYDYSQQAPPKK